MQILLRYKYFVILYLVFLLLRIFVGPMMQEINLFFAGTIVALLLIFYILRVKHQNQSYILSMILAMIADISLAFMKESSFTISYLAYGLASIGLILVFKRAQRSVYDNWKLIQGVVLLAGLIYIAITQDAYLGLWWTLPATALLLMSTNLKSGSPQLLVYGGILFSLASYLCYIGEVYAISLLIPHLLFYGLGQLFICFGLVDSYQKALAQRQTSKKK